MPGPSFSPVFAAVGVFLLLLGLVFGGVILALGAIALILTLLYWLAEGLRIYDHDVGALTVTSVPVVIGEPPPGVHMPGPSFRPIMGAIGVFLLIVGFVFGGWLLIAGVIALIATLVGWLVDARKEYVRTVEADRTGHLENGPAPRTPSGTLTALAVLVLGAIFLQATVFATNEANGGTAGAGGGAAASGAPAPGGSGGAGGSGGPAPSGAVGGRCPDRGEEHHVRHVVLHRQGRQAIHDRLRQPGRRDASQRRAQERVGRDRVPGRRHSTASLRRPTTFPRRPPASTRSCAPSIRR